MRLGDITEPKIGQPGLPSTGHFTYVDISSVDNSAKRIVEPKRLPANSAPSRARQRLHSGDVLVSMTRPNLNAVALVPPELDGAIGSTGFHVLRARDGVLPQWLYYGVQTRQIVGAMSELVQGALYPAVRPKDIRAFNIPLPELDEQRRIVAALERQFSRLDEAVASLKRVKASISRYQASAISEAAGSDRRWPTCRIADLLRERIVNGLSVKESTTPTSVRALRLSAMSEDGLNYADHRFLPVEPASVDDIFVEEGDFFVSRGNGSLALVGRGAIAQTPPFPVIFPDTMMRLRFVDPDVRRWVATLWPSRLVRRQIEQRVKTTAGIYKIAQPQVASISLPVPPAPERERIVAEVDRRLSIVREVEAEVDANLKRAQALRQAVLARAFAVPGEAGK
jgi:type I restriction enzyme S subunit